MGQKVRVGRRRKNRNEEECMNEGVVHTHIYSVNMYIHVYM